MWQSPIKRAYYPLFETVSKKYDDELINDQRSSDPFGAVYLAKLVVSFF